MFFLNLYMLALWMKVALALEGLNMCNKCVWSADHLAKHRQDFLGNPVIFSALAVVDNGFLMRGERASGDYCCHSHRCGNRALCARRHETIHKQILTLPMLRGYFCPKHKDAKIFEKHLNPIILVFIG